MSSELAYTAAVELNGTTVHVPPRAENRRNRSCRATGSTPHDSHSRSHSRHRNVRQTRDKSNDRRDLSALDSHAGGDGKENFLVPCTPKTPRQKQQRPCTIGASPPRSYPRTPSSPPACLTTTLPIASEIQHILVYEKLRVHCGTFYVAILIGCNTHNSFFSVHLFVFVCQSRTGS